MAAGEGVEGTDRVPFEGAQKLVRLKAEGLAIGMGEACSPGIKKAGRRAPMALARGLKLGRQEPIPKRLRGSLKCSREGQ